MGREEVERSREGREGREGRGVEFVEGIEKVGGGRGQGREYCLGEFEFRGI